MGRTPLSDEERKERRKANSQLYYKKNKEKLKEKSRLQYAKIRKIKKITLEEYDELIKYKNVILQFKSLKE